MEHMPDIDVKTIRNWILGKIDRWKSTGKGVKSHEGTSYSDDGIDSDCDSFRGAAGVFADAYVRSTRVDGDVFQRSDCFLGVQRGCGCAGAYKVSELSGGQNRATAMGETTVS